MQTIYSMHQNSSDDLGKEQKFLFQSIENIQDLYLIMVSIFIEIQQLEEKHIQISLKKHLATSEEKNPNLKFVKNQVLNLLSDNNSISTALESRKINNWKTDDSYIQILLNEIKESNLYADYMSDIKNSFEKDKDFVADIFTDIIAPNVKLYEYLEDNKLTWIDDIPIINTLILKQLKTLKNSKNDYFVVPSVFSDNEDKEFATDLFQKTVLNEKELAITFADKTPNWDSDRIAEIDTIILKMAICEVLRFPSIPVKVTINEYIEIAKEYSTPKSSFFINGILDNLIKEFEATKKITKIGRGLM